jgi:aryl-alcohol dehydrogenase-like predicted oxidoreductase
MKYKLLGNSGLRVSEVALGTMTFGEDWGWGANKETAQGIYTAYREAGGNFVDTANFYTNGTSERIVGELIASERDEIVLATKFSTATSETNPNASGLGRKNMTQAVEASLKRLNTEYIDLYWIHLWDFLTPVEEVMRGLDDLVRSGKVLYVGISDTPAWIASEAQMLAKLRGWSPFIGLQIEYSLVQRTVERELLPFAHAHDLGVLAWSPLAEGVLTGKYSRKNREADSEQPNSSRQDKMDLRRLNERSLAIVDAVQDLADEIGRHPAQVALNWLRAKGTIPMLGASKLSQMQSNLAALEFELTDQQVATLDEVSSIDFGFPYDFYTTVIQGMYGSFAGRIAPEQLVRNGAVAPLVEAIAEAAKSGTNAAWGR